jgi:hypothetical protein
VEVVVSGTVVVVVPESSSTPQVFPSEQRFQLLLDKEELATLPAEAHRAKVAVDKTLSLGPSPSKAVEVRTSKVVPVVAVVLDQPARLQIRPIPTLPRNPS